MSSRRRNLSGESVGALLIAASNAPQSRQQMADMVCDGINDAALIASAVSSVSALGGAIVFSEGTFKFDAALSGILRSGMTLRGMGRGATTFQLLANANCRLLDNQSAIDDIVLCGITFDGNGTHQSDGASRDDRSLVYLTNITGLTVSDCKVINTRHGAGLRIGACNDVSVSRNQFATNGVAGAAFICDSCYVGDCNGVRVTDNYVGACSDTGIAIDGSQHAVVKANTLITPTSNCISISPSPSNAAKYVTVAGNTCFGDGSAGCYGIHFDNFNGSAECDQVIIANNVVRNTNIGIMVSANSINTVVEGNSAQGTVDAIATNTPAAGTVNNLSLKNNNVRGTSGTGIHFNGTAIASGSMVDNDLSEATAAVGGPVTNVSPIRNNKGYTTSARGATANVADGGTITHGLITTPVTVRATGTVAGQIITVTAKGATTFTVAVKNNDGTVGTAQTIYWEADIF